MPETLYWHKFKCQTPIPIQLTKPTNCYKDKNTGVEIPGECLPDWIEQGLGLTAKNPQTNQNSLIHSSMNNGLSP